MSESDLKLTNAQVLDTIRFLIEMHPEPYPKRYYIDWLVQFLVDHNARANSSHLRAEEARQQRVAERDAKKAKEKVEEKDTRIADRNAYIQNHLIPEIIHSCFQLDTADPNYAQTVQLTLARIEGLKQACENFTGTWANRIEKHKKDGDLYNDSLRRRASELRENLVNIK